MTPIKPGKKVPPISRSAPTRSRTSETVRTIEKRHQSRLRISEPPKLERVWKTAGANAIDTGIPINTMLFSFRDVYWRRRLMAQKITAAMSRPRSSRSAEPLSIDEVLNQSPGMPISQSSIVPTRFRPRLPRKIPRTMAAMAIPSTASVLVISTESNSENCLVTLVQE